MSPKKNRSYLRPGLPFHSTNAHLSAAEQYFLKQAHFAHATLSKEKRRALLGRLKPAQASIKERARRFTEVMKELVKFFKAVEQGEHQGHLLHKHPSVRYNIKELIAEAVVGEGLSYLIVNVSRAHSDSDLTVFFEREVRARLNEKKILKKKHSREQWQGAFMAEREILFRELKEALPKIGDASWRMLAEVVEEMYSNYPTHSSEKYAANSAHELLGQLPVLLGAPTNRLLRLVSKKYHLE